MNKIKVSHHLLLCATPTKQACCKSAAGAGSWEALKRILKELKLEELHNTEGIVLRSKVDCLRICSGGPILLVWPDGIWYGGVTPERIEKIINQHIINGMPINEWIIRRTPIKLA